MGNSSLKGCCGIGERRCEYAGSPHSFSKLATVPEVDEDAEEQKRSPMPPTTVSEIKHPGPTEAPAPEVAPAPKAEDVPAQVPAAHPDAAESGEAAAAEPEPAPEPRTAAAEEPATSAADAPSTEVGAPAASDAPQAPPKEAEPEQKSADRAAKIWTVVGGADKGGLLVRRGCELSSAELPDRIATGAKIREVARAAERLKFQKVGGRGPEEGWITTKVKGRDMLAAA